MRTQPIVSRNTSFLICLVLGLVGTLAAIVGMIVDQAGGNSVAAHIEEIYRPYGKDPDPNLIWWILYAVFTTGAICWAIALRGSLRQYRWTRMWSTIAFVVGGSVLAYLAVVSEYDSAILPMAWRIVCSVMAIFGLITILIAWLPVNGRIRS